MTYWLLKEKSKKKKFLDTSNFENVFSITLLTRSSIINIFLVSKTFLTLIRLGFLKVVFSEGDGGVNLTTPFIFQEELI